MAVLLTRSRRERVTYHIQRSGITTLCGRDCSDWQRIGERDPAEAASYANCCKRCAAALTTEKSNG